MLYQVSFLCSVFSHLGEIISFRELYVFPHLGSCFPFFFSELTVAVLVTYLPIWIWFEGFRILCLIVVSGFKCFYFLILLIYMVFWNIYGEIQNMEYLFPSDFFSLFIFCLCIILHSCHHRFTQFCFFLT